MKKKQLGRSKEELLAKRIPMGRPRIYDAHKIATEMTEWAKCEDSINLAQFCADRGYLPTLIWRLEKESEEFSEVYMLTKLRLAERRERLLNGETLNYGAWQRYQRSYDAFLAKDEENKDDKDAVRRKGVIHSEQMNLVMLAKMAAEGSITNKDES